MYPLNYPTSETSKAFSRFKNSLASLSFLLVLFAAISTGTSSSGAQTGELVLEVDPPVPPAVEAGEEVCFDVIYGWSSVTENVSGVEVIVKLPAVFGGAPPKTLSFAPCADFENFLRFLKLKNFLSRVW